MIQKNFKTIKSPTQTKDKSTINVCRCLCGHEERHDRTTAHHEHELSGNQGYWCFLYRSLCCLIVWNKHFFLLWFWEGKCNKSCLVKGFHGCQAGCSLDCQISPDGTCGSPYLPFKVEQTTGSSDGQDHARCVPGQNKIPPGHVG